MTAPDLNTLQAEIDTWIKMFERALRLRGENQREFELARTKAQLLTKIQEYGDACRASELENVMRETETGDVSIWIYKWAKKRLAELRGSDEG